MGKMSNTKTQERDETIIGYESQILHFISKYRKHVYEIFFRTEVSFDIFQDPDIKMICRIIYNYYKRHGEIPVKVEFENLIDALLESKKISKEKHNNLLITYEESQDLDLEEEQFERIFREWMQAALVPKIKDIVLNNSEKFLNDYKGLDFIETIQKELRRMYLQSDDAKIEIVDLVESSESQLALYQKRRNEQEDLIRTGIKKLDEKFLGFGKKTITMIVALTGVGKSTLALDLSYNAYEKQDKNVLCVSLEMPKEQWMQKFDCIHFFNKGMPVSYIGLRSGDTHVVTEEQMEQIKKVHEERRESKRENQYKVLQAPAGRFSWADIVSEFETKLPTFKPDIIFVDYLALFDLGTSSKDRHIVLGNITKEIREYAKQKDIAIVIVVQANRSAIQRYRGERVIEVGPENIEGSNLVAEDADNILAITRPDEDRSEVEITIGKQREGMAGQDVKVTLKAFYDFCVFFDDNDVPFLTGESVGLDSFEEDEDYDTGISEEFDIIDKVLGEESNETSDTALMVAEGEEAKNSETTEEDIEKLSQKRMEKIEDPEIRKIMEKREELSAARLFSPKYRREELRRKGWLSKKDVGV